MYESSNNIFKKAFVTSYKQTISESESFIIFKII